MATFRRGGGGLVGYYRWMLGLLMLLYCYLFVMLPMKTLEEQDETGIIIGSRPIGLEKHLESFRRVASSPALVLRPNASLPIIKPGTTKMYGKPENMLQAINTAAANNDASKTLPVRPNNDNLHLPMARRRKLQEKLDEVYLETGRPYDGDLWELSDYIPQWMKGMGVGKIRATKKDVFIWISLVSRFDCGCSFLF